jgi:protein TonB
MNQNAILQSNLLDIIFENRNKEYGAYAIRKSYNSRMRVALLSMAALSLSLCFLFLDKSTMVSKMQNTVVSIPDRNILDYQPPPKPEHKTVVNNIHPKKTNPNELPPKIVDSVNINKIPATPLEAMPSLISMAVSEINFPNGGDGPGKNSKVDAEVPAAKTYKPGPVDVADIMPQYPGGIKALLDFLKKNLHSPEDVEEGDEVSVKIKFVVNYNGKLESFDVIKSGGVDFDNEVLRVLKKMPLWIPGKSNGENVSVYYVVPVKFTSEF